MHLQLSPDAPVLLQAAAATALALHVGGAGVGLVSGGVAMVARKGGRIHRLAGNVFFVAMLCMAGVGAAVAPLLPSQRLPNTIAGVFTCYLVATAWMTVKRRPGETGRFEMGATALAFTAAAGAVVMGVLNAFSAHPLGQPQGTVLYIFAAVSALAGMADLSVIRRGGLAGGARLGRHLWRMSLALLIAAGSFAGQPKAIPHFLRGSPLLFLPMLAVLIAMIWWLWRVRRRPAARPAAA